MKRSNLAASFFAWFGLSPVMGAIILCLAPPATLTAQDLAPESVADMVYAVGVREPFPTSIAAVEELPHSAILGQNGIRTRINISLREGVVSPATYSWVKTSTKTATLNLTGTEIISRLEIAFVAAGRGTYREIREGRSIISSGDFLLAPVPREASPPLLNLSSRVTLSAGQLAIQGFVVDGPSQRRVLVRAIGPSLAQFGVTNPVANPALTIFRGTVQIGANTVWGGSTSLAADFTAAGAFALPATSRDSAIVLTL